MQLLYIIIIFRRPSIWLVNDLHQAASDATMLKLTFSSLGTGQPVFIMLYIKRVGSHRYVRVTSQTVLDFLSVSIISYRWDPLPICHVPC